MKRQPTEWEKICTNNTSDKGSTSKFYKELIPQYPPPTKSTKQSIKKWTEALSRHFKEVMQWPTEHMKQNI